MIKCLLKFEPLRGVVVILAITMFGKMPHLGCKNPLPVKRRALPRFVEEPFDSASRLGRHSDHIDPIYRGENQFRVNLL